MDSETYVHRSGRTGRAGQKGTCITLFTHPQEPLIQRLESDLKMKLKRIGAPQVADLVKHAAKEGKYLKRRRSNVAVIIVRIVFLSSFLFYCLLLNHSFQTNR